MENSQKLTSSFQTVESPSSGQKLTKEQKEAIGLLSFGTFFEYFDFMLIMHMGTVLNSLFFAEEYKQTFINATAFAITYLFRPLGSLVIGKFGDKYGRTSTIVVTTSMMALSCLMMVIIPTYAEMGIIASVLFIFCRIIQGVAASNEIVGAELYLTETIEKKSVLYPAVVWIAVTTIIGGACAIGLGGLVLKNNMNWRYAFAFGALIAVCGAYARKRLRETPEFIRHLTAQEFCNGNGNGVVKNSVRLAYFVIQSAWAPSYYFVYMFAPTILKSQFGYSNADVMSHNFKLAIVQALVYIVFRGVTVIAVNPIHVSRIMCAFFIGFLMFLPSLTSRIASPSDLMLIQCIFLAIGVSDMPVATITFKYFPVYKRFANSSFIWSLARAFTYIVTSYVTVFLFEEYSYTGLLALFLPICVAYWFSLSFFKRLEEESLGRSLPLFN